MPFGILPSTLYAAAKPRSRAPDVTPLACSPRRRRVSPPPRFACPILALASCQFRPVGSPWTGNARVPRASTHRNPSWTSRDLTLPIPSPTGAIPFGHTHDAAVDLMCPARARRRHDPEPLRVFDAPFRATTAVLSPCPSTPILVAISPSPRSRSVRGVASPLGRSIERLACA
jgi:hypothetical protein